MYGYGRLLTMKGFHLKRPNVKLVVNRAIDYMALWCASGPPKVAVDTGKSFEG